MMETQNRYFLYDKPYPKTFGNTLRKALRCARAAGYRLALDRSRPVITEKKYNTAVCAIFKNEAPYFKEWLEFNHLVGVEHFYLYDNNSEDDYRPILQPYIDSGLVTLTPWPHNQKQMECYMDCIEKFASETKWLGFIDIDEFIVPKSTENLYGFLQPFEKNRGSVLIYWRLYGTSGRMDRDLNSLVAEDFTVCWPKYCDIGKCFYNTAYGFDPASGNTNGMHHRFWANQHGKDLPPVNCFGKVSVPGREVAKAADFPIQINHYFTKSWKEYAMKKSKGDVFFTVNPHDEAYFFEHERRCTGTDYSAYRYLVKLKQAMGMTGHE